jgi:4'-phosphopantetheinyl transferase EntD
MRDADATLFDPSVLQSTLESMLGAGVAVSIAAPALQDARLFPDELLYLKQAVESRRAEFGTARVCAREALAKLGIAPQSLVPHYDRSPRWPAGIKGSISHTKGCCAVAVTNAPAILGLGIDLEEDVPLPAELESSICTPEEQAWIGTIASFEAETLGKLIFSAKEAFYKCQYAVTGTPIEFQDVVLKFDLAARTFAVAAIKRQGRQWEQIREMRGQFQKEAGLIVTSAVLTSGLGRR